MKLGNINKFLAGGQMGGDPTQALLQGAQLAIQNLDCSIAMQVCLMLILALGGGAPAPAEAAPAPAEQEPVYRKGGKLLRRIKA